MKLFHILIAALCLCSQLPAALILEIDVSDPSAVVFTAVPNVASANSSGYSAEEGINLIDFFTSAVGVVNGNSLLPSALSLDGVVMDSFLYGDFVFSGDNLNIYAADSSDPISIVAGEIPFSGSVTFNLSGVAGLLPLSGATGNIQGGDSTPVGSVFGQWQAVGVAVIPEPSTYLMIISAVGLTGFVFYRRRRSTKSAESA
ncbi:PEP-CTERM sorting domain-containing protein [Cerasicoccus arenae]|uniref:Ice-binding protein C-terminal domain-containing protein n=1 Tax=Cerasicoccus arenae TaxID=424488 RepID=A0A8J3DDR9_9BACT|nr:PEP-CTERM sorting domain-containing protein [Cerasicoccus arenae]MBK1857393.1 PEP-CTERM sorting domain-containing protein [Cerasicoccus arenae]GHC07977.1 hypothetical protein GCM10007047_26560 [Cerasicoccus arenae]